MSSCFREAGLGVSSLGASFVDPGPLVSGLLLEGAACAGDAPSSWESKAPAQVENWSDSGAILEVLFSELSTSDLSTKPACLHFFLSFQAYSCLICPVTRFWKGGQL